MTTEISISGRKIGNHHPPYIIAEMSANHHGSLDRAFRIIDAAASAGADALKIQTYLPDTLTIESNQTDFQIVDGLWAGRTLYDLYEWAHTPWEWHAPLFEHARKRDIVLFSSPFDTTAVDLLEDLEAPAYKIASFEATDHRLIRYAASTGKPMIISTGMADAEEIEDAVTCARDAGCRQLALLHCVSGYPAPVADMNLRTISDMAKRFGVPVGLSDHTLTSTAAITSIAMGATLIEKHFTLDREAVGADDSFSIEPSELEQLICGVREASSSLGEVTYSLKQSECENIKFRRSLYMVEDAKKGDIITTRNMRSIRPGYGLSPKYFDALLGKKLGCDVCRGTALTPELIEDLEA